MTAISELTHDDTAQVIDLRPLTTRIGAEVHGLDLTRPLTEGELEGLKAGLTRWKVLFFRGQHLDHASHTNFAAQFGPLTYPNLYDAGYATSLDDELPPPDYPEEEVRLWRGYPELSRLDNLRLEANKGKFAKTTTAPAKSPNSFLNVHIDSSPLLNPPTYSVLRADLIPPLGGDTQWFDAEAAYEGLSPPVRKFLDTLWAEHRLTVPPHREGWESRTWATTHPLVRVIPETGQRALMLSPTLVTHVLDVTPDESNWILGLLYRELTRPGYAVRFKWEAGDLAISDNRTTVHLGPQDVGARDARVLYLAIVSGDVPVSVDGKKSVSVLGEPKPASPRRPAFAEA